MAFGHDGGRDVIRTFSPPVGFADSPLSEGAKKAVARRAKIVLSRRTNPLQMSVRHV